MNKIISEKFKKLTITTIVLVFSFILLAPTADARWENWSKPQKQIITPSGDIDPWDEFDIYDPPPEDDNKLFNLFSFTKMSFITYLYITFNFTESKNNIETTTLDTSENNSRQTTTNR